MAACASLIFYFITMLITTIFNSPVNGFIRGETGFFDRTGGPGMQDFIGDKGEMGDTGIPGPDGLPGRPGFKGPKGVSGFPGRDGFPGIPGVKGNKGDKGERGFLGFDGLLGIPGPKGEKGDKGDPGFPGQAGIPGVPGLIGDIGEMGDTGIPGPDGLPGRPGFKGPKGVSGFPGRDGFPGIPGVIGNKGDKGPPGKCSCDSKTIVGDNYSYDDDMGTTPDKPDSRLCSERGKTNVPRFYVGKKSLPIEVKCNEYGATCVKTPTVIQIESEEVAEPYWISEHIGDAIMKEIYNLTGSQILWLQERSTSVNQTMRYHCKNSQPYNEKHLNTSLQLLSFNDLIIGPVRTQLTPFYYTVSEDGCTLAQKDEYSHTDIVIQTGMVRRLPVMDFLLRDVRNEHQAFKLEFIELCFK